MKQININFRRWNIYTDRAPLVSRHSYMRPTTMMERLFSYCTLISSLHYFSDREKGRGRITLWHLLFYSIGLVAWEVSGDIRAHCRNW